MPIFLCGIDITDDLDVTRVPAAKSQLVRQTDELDVFEGIKTHEFGRDGINGHLVTRGQDHVLAVRDHAPRARPVTGEGSVHHREDATVDLLLNHQQVDQRLVDHRVRPVAMFVEQTAKGILHGAGCGGEHVGLDRRQMDDVFADEPLGNHEALGIDLVQAQKLVSEITDGVADIDPFDVLLVQMDIPQFVCVGNIDLLVLAFTEAGVDDHGTVVAAMDQVGIVTVTLHGANNPVQLPRHGR